jgi:hypothetical protein
VEVTVEATTHATKPRSVRFLTWASQWRGQDFTDASGLTWHRDWFKLTVLGRAADKVRHVNMDRPIETKPQYRPDVSAGAADPGPDESL